MNASSNPLQGHSKGYVLRLPLMSKIRFFVESFRTILTAFVAATMFAFDAPSSAQGAASPDTPKWLRERIDRYAQSPLGLAPDSIWKYEVDGKWVYYIPAPSGGQADELFDADGRSFCSVDAGSAGKSATKCSQQVQGPSRLQLVWRDPRLGSTYQPGVPIK